MSTEGAVATARRALSGSLLVVGEDASPMEGAPRVAQMLARRDRVPPDVALLPRRALVAMDFSQASARAARAAFLILASGGTITLAHVAPAVDFRELGKEGFGQIYDRGVAGLFEHLAGELRIPGEVDVETVVLRGDVSTHLLEIAARGAFELIAAGSQTAPWIEWHLTGSVSTSLLRGARCAVLIAPPPDARL